MAVAPNRPLHCPLLGSSLNEPPKTQTGHSSVQNPLGAPPFLRAKASVLSVTGPARLGWLPATSLTCFLPFASLSSQLQSHFHTSRTSALAVFSAQNVLSFLHGSFPHFLQVFTQSYPWSPNISVTLRDWEGENNIFLDVQARPLCAGDERGPSGPRSEGTAEGSSWR